MSALQAFFTENLRDLIGIFTGIIGCLFVWLAPGKYKAKCCGIFTVERKINNRPVASTIIFGAILALLFWAKGILTVDPKMPGIPHEILFGAKILVVIWLLGTFFNLTVLTTAKDQNPFWADAKFMGVFCFATATIVFGTINIAKCAIFIILSYCFIKNLKIVDKALKFRGFCACTLCFLCFFLLVNINKQKLADEIGNLFPNQQTIEAASAEAAPIKEMATKAIP